MTIPEGQNKNIALLTKKLCDRLELDDQDRKTMYALALKIMTEGEA